MTRAEQYRRNIGNKFHEDGSVRDFAGNTVISFIDHTDPIFQLFCQVRAMLQSSCAGNCFTYLPDESIHMTVFEGVCNQWREAALWTNLLPVTSSLTDVDKLFEQQFRHAPALGNVFMRAVGIKTGGGYGISLEPKTLEDGEKLAAYREVLSKLMGIRFPGHDTYQYHISICYGVKMPNAVQEAALDAFEKDAAEFVVSQNIAFKVQEPHMTYFKNMFGFQITRFERH